MTGDRYELVPLPNAIEYQEFEGVEIQGMIEPEVEVI